MKDQTDKTIITIDIIQMKQKELSELTDQELLVEAKKMKSTYISNAVFIGFMIGIIVYSIVKNSLGFFTLIPLFFVYKVFNNSKNNKALEKLLKERNLEGTMVENGKVYYFAQNRTVNKRNSVSQKHQSNSLQLLN